MTSQLLHTKVAEIHRLARAAIAHRLEGTPYSMAKCIIDIWAEPDGTVVLHLNSGGNACEVTNTLPVRYTTESALHPEYGVLMWIR